MFAKGDRVSVLDEAVNGVVILIKNNEITIETDDGFVLNFSPSELIKDISNPDLNKSFTNRALINGNTNSGR